MTTQTDKKTYQVINKMSWYCPGALLFVEDGFIVGHQLNPENSLTLLYYEYTELTDLEQFDDSDYEFILEVTKPVSIARFKEIYRNSRSSLRNA